jgi:branched-subunit amino acid transport protein
MMNEWFLIGGMALLTFTFRYGLLGVSGRVSLSPKLTHLLRYVPPAVLTAIVAPAVLMPTGNDLMLTHTNARLMGAIAAILVGYRTKNLLLTIVVGMLTFLSWQWLVQ